MSPCPLWDFALAHYRREGVAPLCLALQERYGADVNLLFLALWLATEGRALTPAGSPASAVADWHAKVVRPLRGARQAMKGWPMPPGGPTDVERDAVRARLQAVEIETERLELAMLGAWAATADLDAAVDRDAALIGNLRVVLPAAAEDPDLARLAGLFRE